jgi:hypothetical protein
LAADILYTNSSLKGCCPFVTIHAQFVCTKQFCRAGAGDVKSRILSQAGAGAGIKMYTILSFSLYIFSKENESEPELHHFAMPEPDPEPHLTDAAPQPGYSVMIFIRLTTIIRTLN